MYLHKQLQPDNPIMLTKVDCCNPAYRQINMKATTAVTKLCMHINDLLLVALRMTFWGHGQEPITCDEGCFRGDHRPCPNQHCQKDGLGRPEVFHSPHQNLLDSDKAAVDNDKGTVDKLRKKFGKADFFAAKYPPDNDDDVGSSILLLRGRHFWGLQSARGCRKKRTSRNPSRVKSLSPVMISSPC